MDLNALLHSPYAQTVVAFWLLSMLAHTMPAPRADTGRGYRWLFNISQWLLANLGKIQQGVPATPPPQPPPGADQMGMKGY